MFIERVAGPRQERSPPALANAGPTAVCTAWAGRPTRPGAPSDLAWRRNPQNRGLGSVLPISPNQGRVRSLRATPRLAPADGHCSSRQMVIVARLARALAHRRERKWPSAALFNGRGALGAPYLLQRE